MVKIDDKGLHAGLLHIIREKATFELKGSEVELFAQILVWLKNDVPELLKLKKEKAIGKEFIKENK